MAQQRLAHLAEIVRQRPETPFRVARRDRIYCERDLEVVRETVPAGSSPRWNDE